MLLDITREIARSGGMHRLVGYVASAVGLITLFAWWEGYPTPSAGLDALAAWLGFGISDHLVPANEWLNDERRHDAVVHGCVAVMAIALIVHAGRLATQHSQMAAAFGSKRPGAVRDAHRWIGAYNMRFWSIIWIATAVLAELAAVSPREAVRGLLLILAVCLVADLFDAKAAAEDFQARFRDGIAAAALVSVGCSVAWAAMSLGALPLRLWGFLAHPPIKPSASDR